MRNSDRGPATITRTDRRRSIKITADVDGDTNANEVVARFTQRGAREVADALPGVRYAFEGEQKDQATACARSGSDSSAPW